MAKAYGRQPHLKSCTKSYGIIHATADLQAGSLSIPLYLMTRKELRKYGSSGIGFARSSIYMIGGEVKGRELPWIKFEHSKFNRYVIAPFERSKGSKFIMVSDIKVDRIYFK